MKILIIEDNVELQHTLKEIFELDNYIVETASDGEEGIQLAKLTEPDVILLDIMLPKIDGFQVCKILREKGINTPILMLTAKDTTKDKVKGLDIGADDYLPKPFDIDELLARVRALIRRNSAQKTDIYKIGDYTFDLSAKKVEKNGKPIELSQKLFCILEQLLRNRGKVVSYETLMNKCWDINDYPTKETVRAHIKLLRKALNDKDLIQNVSGMGYKIEWNLMSFQKQD